ncbi:ligand-binding sensor domain-containing protein [Haliscomenobacter sp.]|uniref:ligand-binding sensor domain-containing protein n=1 Tax=Haliscomenobacter sp. TaxID=2717303 RepID=UPI003BAD8D8F
MIKTPVIPFIYWLYSFLFLSVSSSVFSQNDLIFNELSSNNGLEDSKTVFVYKDSRGFTWIGTLGSLYRFDGSEVLAYGSAKGVTESYLQSSMFEDKRGNLWFCTFDKLFCYERQRDTCLTFGGFKEKNGVETIADYGLIHLDKQDQLWVTAGGNVFRLNLSQTLKHKKLSFNTIATGNAKIEGKRFYPLLNQQEELTGFFEYFLIGSGMKLWTRSTTNQGFTSKAFFSADHTQSPPLKIKEVLPISGQNNQYFLITSEGIVTFSSSKEHFSTFFKPPSDLRLFFAIYVQPNVLLCSTNEGLHYLNIQTKHWSKATDWSAKLNTNEISRKNIRDLYLDRDNVLWAMVYDEGLCFTNPTLFRASFTPLDYKVENWLEVSKNEWLYGTPNGLLLIKNGEEKKRFLTARITGIHKDHKNNIWVISDTGLYTFNAQSQTLTKIRDDSDYLFGFYQSSDGTYWIGTTKDTKKWDPIQNQKKDINAYTAMLLGGRSFWEDPIYKRFYLQENSSNLHIMHYHEGNWKKDTVFSIKGFLAGYLLPKGSDKVWVGTVSGIKLIHRTKATIEDLPFPPTWPNTNITGMVQDPQGTIWVSTNSNILSFDAKGKPLRMYAAREGFIAGPFQNEGMRVLADQSIGIIGKYGLNRFEPARLNQKHPLPKIQITRLSIQGNPYQKLFPQDTSISEKKWIRLKYRQNSIALRLVGIEMGQPNQVKIQYYLKNWEKSSEASIRNQFAEVRYSKLNPGTYTLLARAANANGEWTPWTPKLQIEVVPPIRMRWWFKLIAGLAGAMVVAAGVQFYYRAKLLDARIRNEEQERILRDIHDLTSGKVVFFQDFQSFAEQEIPGTEAKAKALGIADQALQLFKRISAAVRNSTESDSTLLEFLQQLIAESKKNVGNNLIFSTKLDSSIPYAWVAGEYKKHLRLVLQEAIGNTLKHAKATNLLLSIKIEEGILKIALKDNGMGILESKIAQIKPTEKIQDSGNGLGNMLARIKQIGGEIKWSNDQGTVVLISISLHKIRPRRKIFFNFMRF